VTWKVVYTKQALKDAEKIASSPFRRPVERLIAILAEDPFQNPPRYEKLVGDLAGASTSNTDLSIRCLRRTES